MSKVYNSFLVFCLEQRSWLQIEYPDYLNSEITSILGKKWRNMSEEQKKKYKNIALCNRQVGRLFF